jgi:hypothetical protein
MSAGGATTALSYGMQAGKLAAALVLTLVLSAGARAVASCCCWLERLHLAAVGLSGCLLLLAPLHDAPLPVLRSSVARGRADTAASQLLLREATVSLGIVPSQAAGRSPSAALQQSSGG